MAIEWPKPWRAVDDRHRAYITRELAWELSHFPDHSLSGRPFAVVAMFDLYDNAIIQLEGGDYAYVHLSWKAEKPQFEPIGDEGSLSRFLSDGTLLR